MVAIRNFNRFDCGGVLIGCHTILTAAQCVDERHGRDSHPLLWLNPTETETPSNETLVRHTSAVRIHPNYTGDVVDGHDFAVLLMEEPADGLIPIRTSTNAFLAISPGQEVSMLGFGRSTRTSSRTPYIQITRFNVINSTACRNSDEVIYLDGQMLCLEGNPPCSGDQGGPIFTDSGSATGDTLIAIVSSTVCDLNTRIAAVLSTITSEVYDWIVETMEELENTVPDRRLRQASPGDFLDGLEAMGSTTSEFEQFLFLLESADGC
eukprot:g4015.t1